MLQAKAWWRQRLTLLPSNKLFVQSAFGERRAIESSVVQVSDIRQSVAGRARTASKDATRQLLSLSKIGSV